MDALELDHRAHRAGLFDGDFLDQTDKLLAWAHLIRADFGAVLQNADEFRRSDDRTAFDRH